MKTIPSLAAAALCAALLAGCAGSPEESTQQFYAMNTVMSVTAYGPQGEAAARQAVEEVYRLERLLSVTETGSELYALNHALGQWIPLSEDTLELLSFALEMGEETGGALDVTLDPVVRAWGFTTGEYRVPGEEELAELLERAGLERVGLDREGSRARLPQGMELDLGAVGKGYAADRLKELLEEQGVESAILWLGGNVQALGAKPDGSPWRIGVQDPAGEEGESLGVLEVTDRAVVTSGGYQRYFEEDGQIYWHILDPETGLPARSGLSSVTVVGKSGALCDALSTALFVMGEEKAAEYWRAHRDFEAILVRDDGSVAMTQGLEGSFSLKDRGWEGEVTVILP